MKYLSPVRKELLFIKGLPFFSLFMKTKNILIVFDVGQFFPVPQMQSYAIALVSSLLDFLPPEVCCYQGENN